MSKSSMSVHAQNMQSIKWSYDSLENAKEAFNNSVFFKEAAHDADRLESIYQYMYRHSASPEAAAQIRVQRPQIVTSYSNSSRR